MVLLFYLKFNGASTLLRLKEDDSCVGVVGVTRHRYIRYLLCVGLNVNVPTNLKIHLKSQKQFLYFSSAYWEGVSHGRPDEILL